MVYWVRFLAFCQRLKDRVRVILSNLRVFFANTAGGLGRLIDNVSKLKKIIATVPVAIGAVILALYNMANLPRVVGLDLLENGSFTYQIPRGLAVFAPLAVTGVCLLLMFCSRRILTPWLVSVISLLIPVVILVTNIFPA